MISLEYVRFHHSLLLNYFIILNYLTYISSLFLPAIPCEVLI